MSLGIIKIDHIGVATENSSAQNLFENLLGRPIFKEEHVQSENVLTKFFQVGESKVELLEATGDEGPISSFLTKRGPGIHHIAFEVHDINIAFEEAKKMGLRLLNSAPKKGADNKTIFFIHPKDTSGVLVELCQST